MSESIATAAIRVGGEVWTLPRPSRHHVLIHAWCLAHWRDGSPAKIGKHEQGFMTNSGRFVDREEAGRIAHEAGQTSRLYRCLMSEHLW